MVVDSFLPTLLNVLEREPSLVCLTITGERTEVALIGVYLMILGFEPDPPELDLDRLDLEPLELPPRLLVSDNSTITISTMVISNTVANRICLTATTINTRFQVSPLPNFVKTECV